MISSKFFCFIAIISVTLFAWEGVKSVWVSSSQWANAKTQRTFAQSAVQIEGAATDQDAAIAIYYWLLRCYGHGNGAAAEGVKNSENDIVDAWNGFHAGVGNQCDRYNRMLCEFWMGYKNDWTNNTARRVNVCNNGHVEAALCWGGKNHLFDAHLGFFLYNRDGTEVCTVEELASDFTLMTNPSVNVAPRFIRRATSDVNSVCGMADWHYVTAANACDASNTYSFGDFSPNISISTFSTDFDLRKGETLRRQWKCDTLAVQSASQLSYGFTAQCDQNNYLYTDNHQPKDPRNQKVQSVYFNRISSIANGQRQFGNSYHTYTPELLNGAYSQGAKSASGLVSGNPAAVEPALKPAAANAEGSVVYEIRNIYNYAQCFVEGKYFLKSAGYIKVDFSIDSGATWTNIVNKTATGADTQSFSVEFAKSRWMANQNPTPYNMTAHGSDWTTSFFGYRYLVKIMIKANTTPNDVGLASLTFKNTLANNMYTLPALMPGQNSITVEGSQLTAGCALKVTYAWQENGVNKTDVHYSDALPDNYGIQVNETDTAKVKCTSIEMAVVESPTEIKPVWNLRTTPPSLAIFPNPCNGVVRMEIHPSNMFGSGNARAEIYDINGKMVYSFHDAGRDAIYRIPAFVWDGNNFDGRPVAPGIYLIRISTGDKTLAGNVTVMP